jgi:hypothetical protein
MADFILDPGETIVERINRSLADLIPVLVSSVLIVAAALFGVYIYTTRPEIVPSFVTPDIVFAIVAILFGLVEVQTAGAAENFLFRTVDHPQIVADHLLQFQDELRAAAAHPPEAVEATERNR